MQEAAGRRVPLRWVVIAVAAVLVVAAVVVAVLLTNGSDAQKTSSSPSQSPAPRPLEVRTTVTRVAGALPPPRRRSLERHVGALVKGYLRAAFVDARNGTSAFPGFTPAARSLAARDAGVLTAGDKGIEVRRAAAYISVFADHRRAQGATVRLVLGLTGKRGHTRPMAGRLLLTPTSSGWRVFGYHVARGAGR
jgi:hypothetical protein